MFRGPLGAPQYEAPKPDNETHDLDRSLVECRISSAFWRCLDGLQEARKFHKCLFCFGEGVSAHCVHLTWLHNALLAYYVLVARKTTEEK